MDRIADVNGLATQDAGDRVSLRAQADASRRGATVILTASDEAFVNKYSESLRNRRIPVAVVSPSSNVDWSGT